MHLVQGAPGPPVSGSQEVQKLKVGTPAALAGIFVVAFVGVIVPINDPASLCVNEVADCAGRTRPVALVLVVLVKNPVFRLVPAGLEGNPPGEIAVLGVLATVRELVEAHHGTADTSHVHAFVGMRVARVGMERVKKVGIVFVVKVRVAYSILGIAPDDRDPVAQRLDARFTMVDPEDIQRLLLAEAAVAGRGLGLPRIEAKRQAQRRLGRRIAVIKEILDPAVLVPVERVVADDLLLRRIRLTMAFGRDRAYVNNPQVRVLHNRSARHPRAKESHAVKDEASCQLLTVVVLLWHVRKPLIVLRKIVRQVLIGIDGGLLRQ